MAGNRIPLIGFVLIVFNGAISAGEFDWPQWQGPQRNGISKETGLLQSWPKDGPPLAWRISNIGEGFSTPSVANGRIFAMANRNNDEYVFALSEKDGKEIWAAKIGPVRHGGGGYPGPRCTPTVDGDRVYALGLVGDLLCLDAAKGDVHWRIDLRKEFGGRSGGWGYSESPLIDGDKLIVTPGGRKATLLALNKKTGNVIWSGVIPEGDSAAYSSIRISKAAGVRQYVQFLSRGVVGVSAEDGKFLWRYNKPANGTANIATPVVHDDLVFASSDYGTGGGLVKLTKNGDGIEADEVYFTRNMRNHHGGMILLDGYLYGANSGILVCLDFKTGDVMWNGRPAGKGSIAYADGCFYFRNERGPIFLVKANPKEYEELGRFNQPDRTRRPAWAHPVVANGRLYIADQENLFVYDVKKK